MKAIRVAAFIGLCASQALAYEINNHADMSQRSLEISTLNDSSPNGKLSRIGLKSLPLVDTKQSFPLSADPASSRALGPIPYCFGSISPRESDPAGKWRVSVPLGDPYFPGQQNPNDEQLKQPNWISGEGSQLTIAQLIRYGACYEDEEEPFARSISHFYNPQQGGAAAPLGPNSLDWMLKRGVGTAKSGVNHFTYMDAREAFYKALTHAAAVPDPEVQRAANYVRASNWGTTFQALGHIVHHLQDMGSPQHARSDYHCNSVEACDGLITGGVLGLYRPSGYETYWERQFGLIRGLAQSATIPMLFGLPREFWNINTDGNLVTTDPARPMGANEGIAAYTSTNFTSVGKDFETRVISSTDNTASYAPAFGLRFPTPSGIVNDVNASELFPAESLPVVRDTLCGGSTTNCVMGFMGTEQDPSARTSALSYFSKELLVPRDPNKPNSAVYVGKGVFSQNFFTYVDAANKLVPTAVSYSAGLINYFFRGEMEISLPDEGVYGIVDHAVEKEKGQHGFRFIKMKVKNTTPAIDALYRGTNTSLPQHMTAGQFVAVAKFRRNTCYTPDLMGQIGNITQGDGTIVKSNSAAACRTAVEEILVSNPEPDATALAAGETKAMAFDFATPIPIEATDLLIQIVFRGKLGERIDSMAQSTT
jgi:hypothetical protein